MMPDEPKEPTTPTPGDHAPWTRAQDRRHDRETTGGARREAREEEDVQLGELLWALSADHMRVEVHYHAGRPSATCLAVHDVRAQRSFAIVLEAKALDLLAHGLSRRADEALRAEEWRKRS